MDKKNADKIVVFRIPLPLFEQFKDKCNENFKSMSETFRDFVRDYIRKDKS